MADEDDCLAHKEELEEFPSHGLLDSLVSSFPKEWRGIFAPFTSEHFAVQAACLWLQKKSANERRSEIPPNFIDLIDHLVSDFPVVLNERLLFKPKILLLPLNMQRNTLAFISDQSCCVPGECLDKLVNCLNKFTSGLDDWTLTHLKILELKIRHSKATTKGSPIVREQRNDTENHLPDMNIVTKGSGARFEVLVEKSKLVESSRTIPWFSSVFNVQKRRGNVRSDRTNVLEEGFRSLDDDSGTIDMIDLTDACAQGTHERSDKMFQVDTGSCDILDDCDIEIIEVADNPPREVRHKQDLDVMKEFTVPLPPEHLIIDTEEIPEYSVINTEGVPEDLVIAVEETAHPCLSDAAKQHISALKELLQSLENNEDNFSNELEVFSNCSSLEMECICVQLNLRDIQESSAISLCHHFVTLPTEPSFGNAAVFAANCLLPKVQRLKQAASRDLFSAISQFATKYSRSFCDGVVIRLVQQSKLDNPQVVLVNKIIKDCLREDAIVYLLQLIVSIKANTDGFSFSWTEDTVSVVQTVVDLKPELNEELFGTFASILQQQSSNLSKSPKYAKMLLAVIKLYGRQVSLHVNCFLQILESNETFLKKAGLAALKSTAKN